MLRKLDSGGVDKDAVSCVADRDGKQRSLEVGDDGDSGLAECPSTLKID